MNVYIFHANANANLRCYCSGFQKLGPRLSADHQHGAVTRLSPTPHTFSWGCHRMLSEYSHCQQVGGTICLNFECHLDSEAYHWKMLESLGVYQISP